LKQCGIATGANEATSSECQTSQGPLREPWKYSHPDDRRRVLLFEGELSSYASLASDAPRAERERSDAAAAAEALVARNCRRVGIAGPELQCQGYFHVERSSEPAAGSTTYNSDRLQNARLPVI
jgi:hypothetical protein